MLLGPPGNILVPGIFFASGLAVNFEQMESWAYLLGWCQLNSLDLNCPASSAIFVLLWKRQAWLPSLIVINKKLGFAIRNDDEVLDFWKPENLHTRSGVEDKSEVDKLRSLVQGSLGLYYHQATIASIAEDSYLDQFPEWQELFHQQYFHNSTTSGAISDSAEGSVVDPGWNYFSCTPGELRWRAFTINFSLVGVFGVGYPTVESSIPICTQAIPSSVSAQAANLCSFWHVSPSFLVLTALLLAGVGKKRTIAESSKRSLRTMVLKVVDFHQWQVRFSSS